jgi:hypothetical protein
MTPSSLVRAPFQRADKRVKNTMLSVPETLRNAATQLLDRVRVGLDIPSRAEVMDLADRISTIAQTLEALELRRNEDSKAIAELKGGGKTSKVARPLQVVKAGNAGSDLKESSSLAAAAAKLKGRPKAKADFKPQPKPTAKKSAAKKTTAKATAKPSAAKKKAATAKPKRTAAKKKNSAKKATKPNTAARKTKSSASKAKKSKAKPATKRKSSK